MVSVTWEALFAFQMGSGIFEDTGGVGFWGGAGGLVHLCNLVLRGGGEVYWAQRCQAGSKDLIDASLRARGSGW